jgi:hypothetical protein
MKQSSAARADRRPSCCDPRPAHPLESIHVLELGTLIARPFTGRQLGAFGAKWRSASAGSCRSDAPQWAWRVIAVGHSGWRCSRVTRAKHIARDLTEARGLGFQTWNKDA